MKPKSNEIPTMPSKAAKLSAPDGLNAGVLQILRDGLDGGLFDAVFVPLKVPSNDSYAWVLVENPSLLELANVLPPIMTVQGGRALSSLTKHGPSKKKIAAVLRPCEIRSAIELAKLKQVDLENITLISIDCPGALPIQDYVDNPENGEKVFVEALKANDVETMRPTCKSCVHFAITSPDLHIGWFGVDYMVIPVSQKGEEILEKSGLKPDTGTEKWAKEIEKIKTERQAARDKANAEIKERTNGLNNLASVLSKCVSCHNCMSVCPICYCRRCYFESEAIEFSQDQYMSRAEQKGSIRFSQDVLLFHLGRMSHMTMSCVSCGSCEDACPVDIPVAELFSAVAEDSQALFEYSPGMDIDEPLPLRVFRKEKELGDIERICTDPLKGCDCK